MRAAWGEKIDDHALSAYFIFPGNVPYEEVPPYCGVMDVCVAPFRKEAVERSSVKIFDYLACGKPVVAMDVVVCIPKHSTTSSGGSLVHKE